MDFHLIGKLRDFATDIRLDLHSISGSLNEIQKSLHEQDEARNEAKHADDKQPEAAPTTLELRFPRTIHTHTVLDSKQHEPFEWLKFAVNTFALFAVLGYTALAAYQLVEMKKSADAAKTAADTNTRLVKATFAAYITADIGLQSTVSPEANQWRATVNVGFTNHGKTKTSLFSTYTIMEMSLPDKRRIGVLGSYSVNEIMPRDTDGPMPNHYYPLKWMTETQAGLYRNRYIAFEVDGRLRYDDGFGEIIDVPFCRISTGYTVYGCDQIDAYLPPGLNTPKH